MTRPPRPSRGPRRELTAEPEQLEGWLQQARDATVRGAEAQLLVEREAGLRRDAMRRLHAAGLSHREIAAALGLSVAVVARTVAAAHVS